MISKHPQHTSPTRVFFYVNSIFVYKTFYIVPIDSSKPYFYKKFYITYLWWSEDCHAVGNYGFLVGPFKEVLKKHDQRKIQ